MKNQEMALTTGMVALVPPEGWLSQTGTGAQFTPEYSRESYEVSFGTHTGTHMDSPAHMVENGSPRIDSIPLDTLIGPAKLINIPKESYGKITVDDFENCGVIIEKGDRLIVRTGWYKTWGTKKFFAEYPCFTIEAAKWLVKKGIKLIGMDSPSPDDPLDKLAPGQANPMHYEFLNNGIIIVEYLDNLDEITCTNFDCYLLPLLIKDADGCPIRAIASVDV
jgi:kynurenine formamidase